MTSAVGAPSLTGGGPLAATAKRLAGLDAQLGFDVGRPAGDGWVLLGEVHDGLVEEWVARHSDRLGGFRAVAGGDIARWLVHRVVMTTVACLSTEGRVVEMDAANVAVRRDDAGRFDRTAVLGATFVDLADELGRRPAVGVTASVLTRLAGQLVATLQPFLDGVRRAAPFGRRGLWSTVADSAAATLVALVRLGGLTPEAGLASWEEFGWVLDRMVDAGAPVRSRPVITHVPGTSRLSFVRGSCCVHFSLPAPTAAPMCTTCPIADRRRARG